LVSRRAIVIGGVTNAIVATHPAWAQRSRTIPWIVFQGIGPLITGDKETVFDPFRNRLRDLGYVEGRTIQFEFRHVGNRPERLPEALEQLAQQKVDVIVCGQPQVALAAKRATQTIPIVFATIIDPVGAGIVKSLAKPGGNATGISWDADPKIAGKQLELVHRLRKCLHLYHYQFHPTLGFMNARIQTWFPFSVQICLNGREWLARQMDGEGIAYERHDNTFAGVADFQRAQALLQRDPKAVGLKSWIKKNKEPGYELTDFDFTEGDVVQTLLKCAHGETVLVTHSVSLPRPYSRFNVVQGTNAIYMEDKKGIFIDGKTEEEKWDSIEDYFEEYGHPLWRDYDPNGLNDGHGGMDGLVLKAFAHSVKNRTQTPVDVYDTAAWMAITVLSEQSINLGSSSVAFPDFTNGKWINREAPLKGQYSLDDF
jgi:hypothetical protein